MKRLLLALTIVVGCAAVQPASVRADALGDFERAESLYETQRFAEAARLLETVVESTATDAVQAALILESRKYLAACYLFLGRPAEADVQFERLLQQDPRYEIDPVRFPSDVVAAFERVRTRLTEEAALAEQERARREAEERGARERAEREQEERLRRLEELAGTETVVHTHSRLVAAIPFGVGQFQNGRRRLGITLAVVEGALFATMLTSYFLHEGLQNENPTAADLAAAQRAEKATRILSWTSSASFFLVAGLGILEAELHFQPSRVEVRSRVLPPELQRSEADEGEGVTLRFGPTHVGLHVPF